MFSYAGISTHVQEVYGWHGDWMSVAALLALINFGDSHGMGALCGPGWKVSRLTWNPQWYVYLVWPRGRWHPCSWTPFT